MLFLVVVLTNVLPSYGQAAVIDTVRQSIGARLETVVGTSSIAAASFSPATASPLLQTNTDVTLSLDIRPL